MSDHYEENLCPKCGQISANFDVCDNCGAMMTRIRERKEEYERHAPPADAALDPNAGFTAVPYRYEVAEPRPWLTIVAVCMLVVALISGFIFFKSQPAPGKAKKDHASQEATTGSDEPDAKPETVVAAAETPTPTPEPPPQPAAPALTVTPDPTLDTPVAQQTAAASGSSMANWLNSIKKQGAATGAQPGASTDGEAQPSGPIPTPKPVKTPPPTPTAKPAASGNKKPAAASAKSEIELGEEMFTNGGRSTSRASAVIEKLNQPTETPTPGNAANQQPRQVEFSVVHVTDDNHQSEVLIYSETPVLLAFFSEKAPDSSSIAPAILQLSQQPDPKIKCGIVDVEESKGLRQRYSIAGVPTVILIKEGKEFARYTTDFSIPAINEAVRYVAVKNLPHFQQN